MIKSNRGGIAAGGFVLALSINILTASADSQDGQAGAMTGAEIEALLSDANVYGT